MSSNVPDGAISCSVRTCPSGCSVITIGAVSIHLSEGDYASLVKLLIRHANTHGIDLHSAISQPAGVHCH